MKYTEFKDNKRVAIENTKFLPDILSYNTDVMITTLNEILTEIKFVKHDEYTYLLANKIRLICTLDFNYISIKIYKDNQNYSILVRFQDNGVNLIIIDKDTHLETRKRILSQRIVSDSFFINAILEYTRKLWKET